MVRNENQRNKNMNAKIILRCTMRQQYWSIRVPGKTFGHHERCGNRIVAAAAR